MSTVFKVFNPLTGRYVDATTQQELKTLLAQTAWEFFLAHTHSTPYSVVDIAADGSETWTSANGTSIPSPESFDSEWQSAINQAPTPVEILP
jgi:hypothetical protein